MYKPKQYPEEPCFWIDYDFKNPALRRINGVIYSYCCICDCEIGNEYESDWTSLIRKEYCDSCRDKVRLEQNKERQKKYRRSKKAMKKEFRHQENLLKQQTSILRDENRLLREMIMTLRDDLEQLKAK